MPYKAQRLSSPRQAIGRFSTPTFIGYKYEPDLPADNATALALPKSSSLERNQHAAIPGHAAYTHAISFALAFTESIVDMVGEGIWIGFNEHEKECVKRWMEQLRIKSHKFCFERGLGIVIVAIRHLDN